MKTTIETKTFRNFINNEWKESASGYVIESINPATKEAVGYVQKSTEEELNLGNVYRSGHGLIVERTGALDQDINLT